LPGQGSPFLPRMDFLTFLGRVGSLQLDFGLTHATLTEQNGGI